MASKLSFRNLYDISRYNLGLASAAVSQDFALATEAEKDSWKIRTRYTEEDSTGLYMYLDFFMDVFYETVPSFDTVLVSVTLSSGQLQGFGVDPFGISTFGTVRSGVLVTRGWSDRDLRFFNFFY